MKPETIIVLLGYAITQAYICNVMGAGELERWFGILGSVPVSLWCVKCDKKGE